MSPGFAVGTGGELGMGREKYHGLGGEEDPQKHHVLEKFN